MAKVITYQSPSGATVNLTRAQVQMLERLDSWPRDSRGGEYCKVHHGLHQGEPTYSDDELRATVTASALNNPTLAGSPISNSTVPAAKLPLPSVRMDGVYVAGVECHMTHGGNHRLAALKSGYYECSGCGRSYTAEYVHDKQHG